MLVNFLDNVLCYIEVGIDVFVILFDGLCLIVQDNGLGIFVMECDQVIKCLYCLECSCIMFGNGFGFVLVSVVVELYDVELCLEDVIFGLRVVIDFSKGKK